MSKSPQYADPNELGGGPPKLTPDDLEGDAAILTISSFERGEVDDPESKTGTRVVYQLTFEETGDRVLYLNKGMTQSLVSRLGKNTTAWVGQRVPVEVYPWRFKGQSGRKVGILPAEEWDEALAEAKRARGRKK